MSSNLKFVRSVLKVSRSTRYARLNSTSTASSGIANTHVRAGLIGGATAFLLGYGWYELSGTRKVVSTAKSTLAKFESAKQSVGQGVPNASEATKYLRSTVDSMVGFIPGAKTITDAIFDDMDRISARHGDKVNEILSKTYTEVQDAAKGGLNAQTAEKIMKILRQRTQEVRSLANDIGNDVIEQHPELKEQVGGSLEQLKGLADKAGPEAKKKLDDVYDQIHSITEKGLTPASVASAGYIIKDALQSLQSSAESEWEKAIEAAKPMLDKYPKAKKLLEENADSLKKGDVKELFNQFTSGKSAQDIEAYVTDQLKLAKDAASSEAKK